MPIGSYRWNLAVTTERYGEAIPREGRHIEGWNKQAISQDSSTEMEAFTSNSSGSGSTSSGSTSERASLCRKAHRHGQGWRTSDR